MMRKDIEIDLSRPVTLAELPGLLSSFAIWWLGELLSLLPRRWRKAAGADAKRPALHVVPAPEPSHVLDFKTRVDGNDAEAIPPSGPVDVWIHPDLALRRNLAFPDMPLHHLRSAIALQIDELTPFRRADVLFDFRIARRDVAAQKCVVDIAFLPKRIFSAALSKAGLDRDRVGQIGVRSASGEGLQFQFAFDGNPIPLRTVGFRWALAILAILSGPYAVAWAWHTASVQERRKLEEQIQTLRPQAETAREAGAQLQAMEAPAKALSSVGEPGAPLNVLAAVSRLNPDTVTLVKVDMENGQVQITGLAKNASAYLELLEKSPEFEAVAFSSPVSAGQIPGVERFSMTMKVSGGRK